MTRRALTPPEDGAVKPCTETADYYRVACAACPNCRVYYHCHDAGMDYYPCAACCDNASIYCEDERGFPQPDAVLDAPLPNG